MKRLLLLILTLVTALAGIGQQYQPEKVNAKAVKLYEQAIEAARADDFKKGIDLLKQAVQVSPDYADAWLSIAGMYGELKDYDNAIFHYEKARAIDSMYFRDYNLPYSINLAGKGRFADALAAVNK
ncbi:MAG TPA: flagellar motor protein MotB, partial [Flavihumibacter sp.]|nr:flagellar motor protein MotB [Flavihumibacter sp.]